MTRCTTRSIIPLLIVVLAAAAAAAAEPVNTTPFGNLAVKGYDPVAYFTDGEPAKGSQEHELEWRGANLSEGALKAYRSQACIYVLVSGRAAGSSRHAEAGPISVAGGVNHVCEQIGRGEVLGVEAYGHKIRELAATLKKTSDGMFHALARRVRRRTDDERFRVDLGKLDRVITTAGKKA